MKFKAKATSDFKKVPEGTHLAICNAVIDVGLQPGSARYPSPKHQVYIRFETPNERVEYEKDGVQVEGPMQIGRMFTASMSEKGYLRPFIESWFAKKFPSDEAAEDFEFSKLVGHKCLINVTHNESNGNTYANIVTATPIPAGMPKDCTQHNPSLVYDLTRPDQNVFDQLPEWLQKKIGERLDDGEPEPATPGFDDDSDIPF